MHAQTRTSFRCASGRTGRCSYDGMARNWYTAEVGEVKELRSLLTALRNLDAVFDAYRVTPS